jgi:capsule polysaccharide modification protein KpsS
LQVKHIRLNGVIPHIEIRQSWHQQHGLGTTKTAGSVRDVPLPALTAKYLRMVIEGKTSGLSQIVEKELALYGFSQFFPKYDGVDEAIEAMTNPPQGDKFPKIIRCPNCSIKIEIKRPGKFRCKECRTILAIDDARLIFLG